MNVLPEYAKMQTSGIIANSQEIPTEININGAITKGRNLLENFIL